MESLICQAVSNFDNKQLKESFSLANKDVYLEENMYRQEMYRCVHNLYYGCISTNVGSRFGVKGIFFRFEYLSFSL